MKPEPLTSLSKFLVTEENMKTGRRPTTRSFAVAHRLKLLRVMLSFIICGALFLKFKEAAH